MTELAKTLAYFQKSSEEDWRVAQTLFLSKNYAHSLFFCHLTLEKLLKAIIVAKTDKAAPYIHDLVKLAKLGDIELDEKTKEALEEITTFNIAGRYDDEKQTFYKKCTRAYAEKYFNLSSSIYLWIKKDYLKK
jgi:HEPN domain-containing protein